jgi:hypothetical protein
MISDVSGTGITVPVIMASLAQKSLMNGPAWKPVANGLGFQPIIAQGTSLAMSSGAAKMPAALGRKHLTLPPVHNAGIFSRQLALILYAKET